MTPATAAGRGAAGPARLSPPCPRSDSLGGPVGKFPRAGGPPGEDFQEEATRSCAAAGPAGGLEGWGTLRLEAVQEGTWALRPCVCAVPRPRTARQDLPPARCGLPQPQRAGELGFTGLGLLGLLLQEGPSGRPGARLPLWCGWGCGVLPAVLLLRRGLGCTLLEIHLSHSDVLLRTYSVPGAILGVWVMSTPGVGSQQTHKHAARAMSNGGQML